MENRSEKQASASSRSGYVRLNTLRTHPIEFISVLVGVASFIVVVSRGDHWIGAVIIGIALSIFAWMFSYLVKGVSRVFIFKTYRHTVRYARIRALKQADADATALMTRKGYIPELTLRVPDDRTWKGLVLQNVVMVCLIVVGSVFIIVATASLFGSCSTFLGDNTFASRGAFFKAFLIATTFAIVSISGACRLDIKHLGLMGMGAVYGAVQGQESRVATVSMNGPIHLPSGGHVVLGVRKNAMGELQCSLSLRPLRFTLTLVSPDALEHEEFDEDLGHRVFDRATLLELENQPSHVIDGWLTPNIRCLLLALLKRGAYVKDGTLWCIVTMWKSADELGRIVALIAALDVEMDALRAETPKTRTLAALDRSDDSTRRRILDRISRLNVSLDAHRLLRLWIQTGQGPTRVYAANALPPLGARNSLWQLWQETGSSVELRGYALARLLSAIETHALEPLDLSTAVDADDYKSLDGVFVSIGHIVEFPVSPLIGDWTSPCIISAELDGLSGLILRLLELRLFERRWSRAPHMTSILDEKRNDLRQRVDAAGEMLSSREHELYVWSLFARVIESIIFHQGLEVEHRKVMRQWQARARAMVAQLTDQQVGGLAIAGGDDRGQVSLASTSDSTA